MDRYELLKQEMLLLANQLNTQKNDYYNKAHNGGLFAAGLYKGHGQQADKVSKQIRQSIRKVDCQTEKKIA